MAKGNIFFSYMIDCILWLLLNTVTFGKNYVWSSYCGISYVEINLDMKSCSLSDLIMTNSDILQLLKMLKFHYNSWKKITMFIEDCTEKKLIRV